MTTMIRNALLLFAAASVLLLTGCVAPQAHPNDPYYAPALPQSTQPPPPANGSIYQSGYEVFLFEDRKASRIGDVLTVMLAEEADGESDSETSLRKSSNTSIDNPTILGKSVDSGVLPGLVGSVIDKLPLASGDITSLETNLSSQSTFDGDADSDQNHELTGTISVTVHDVMPNGLLYVKGEKWVTINQSKEYIRVSGLVRPEDVALDNSIMSTRIADARIEFSGTGPSSNTHRPGWLSRVFLSPMWLF